jgi:hypothetical protein
VCERLPLYRIGDEMFNWITIAEIATRALFLLGDVNNKKIPMGCLPNPASRMIHGSNKCLIVICLYLF